jgi:hypothetical protein
MHTLGADAIDILQLATLSGGHVLRPSRKASPATVSVSSLLLQQTVGEPQLE